MSRVGKSIGSKLMMPLWMLFNAGHGGEVDLMPTRMQGRTRNIPCPDPQYLRHRKRVTRSQYVRGVR